jgi:hypothetical protein
MLNRQLKPVLFASKRINIRLMFAFFRFEPNIRGAPYFCTAFIRLPVSIICGALVYQEQCQFFSFEFTIKVKVES